MLGRMASLLLLLAIGGDPELVALPAARDGLGEATPYKGPLVVAMTSTTCPLSRRFAPVLARLSREFSMPGKSGGSRRPTGATVS